jgi:hypothetical protein
MAVVGSRAERSRRVGEVVIPDLMGSDMWYTIRQVVFPGREETSAPVIGGVYGVREWT